MIFAAIFGLFFFDEQLSFFAWIGMLVIIASGLLAGIGKTTRADNMAPALPAEED